MKTRSGFLQLRPLAILCVASSCFSDPLVAETTPPSATCSISKAAPITGKTLADTLRAADLQKRELETTAEFQARVAPAIASMKKLGDAGGEIPLIVSINPENFKYNADAAKMVVESVIGGIVVHNVLDSSLSLYYSETINETYEATNGFGARIKVGRGVVEEVAITMPKVANERLFAKKRVEFPLSRDDAKNAKADVVVLLSVRLKAPYFTSNQRHTAPKFDYPKDLTVTYDLLHADIRCAAFFNRATGKIIKTVAPSQI